MTEIPKYKEGIHLLNLDKEDEERLIEILECNLKGAIALKKQELLGRIKSLQVLIEMYGELLAVDCHALYLTLHSMENNYKYVLEEYNKE